MVKLNKIYTRSGDAGMTGLVSGERVPKFSARITAIGTIDEANAHIGVVRLETEGDADNMLARIQNDLFDLGADLATPYNSEVAEDQALRISPAQTKRLEEEIDRMNSNLAPLKSFILPGGTPAAAHLHLARCIVRRAERLVVKAARDEKINTAAMEYTNRLSDHLFVMARFLNDHGKADVLWVPGGNR